MASFLVKFLLLLMSLLAESLGLSVTNMTSLATVSLSTVSNVIETHTAAVYNVISISGLLPGTEALLVKEDLKRRDLPTSFVTITRHVEYADATPTPLWPSTSTVVVTITSKVTATLPDYRAQFYGNQRLAVPAPPPVTTKAVRRDEGSGQDIPAAEIVPPVAATNTSSTGDTTSSTMNTTSNGVPYFSYSGLPNPTPTSGVGDGALEGVSVPKAVVLALAVVVVL